MSLPFKIYWNSVLIGEVEITEQDMWYLWGTWKSHNLTESSSFEHQGSTQVFKEVIMNPDLSKVLKVVLVSADDRKIYCLVTHLEGTNLSMRQVIAQEALQKFFPNR